MNELVKFLFTDFWHWLGGLVYLSMICVTLKHLIFINYQRPWKSSEDKEHMSFVKRTDKYREDVMGTLVEISQACIQVRKEDATQKTDK